MLEFETDWYDMMEILLSRLEDEPVNQHKFQVAFLSDYLLCIAIFEYIFLSSGDRLEGLGELGADPARGGHAQAEDQGGNGGEALPEADPGQLHHCQASQPDPQAVRQHEGHQADLQRPIHHSGSFFSSKYITRLSQPVRRCCSMSRKRHPRRLEASDN